MIIASRWSQKMPLPLLVLLCAVLLPACATLEKKQSVSPGIGTAAAAAAPAPMKDREQTQSHLSPDYLLGPDDVIRVTISKHPEWSGEYNVQPHGAITLPGLDPVRVSGLSTYGAAVAITSLLTKQITNPEVTVDMVRYASEVVYVLGEVNRPGKYSTGGKETTLRDAIVMAGLPARYAATGRVYVISPAPAKPQQKVVNLKRILYRGELQRNVRLQPGDIVYVPKNLWGEIADFFGLILSPVSQSMPAAQVLAVP